MQIFKILIVQIVILVNLANFCPLGCSTCDINNKCTQCLDDFSLNLTSGICFYQKCEENLYYQEKFIQQTGQCQAICDQGYLSNEDTKMCKSLEKCSQTFIQQTGISSVGEEIKQIIPFQSDKFIIVYSSYLNIMLVQTGRFLQNLSFKSNAISVKYFQGNFYVFQDDNYIIKWSIDNDIIEKFSYIVDGKIDQNTQIINLNNQFGLVLTWDKKTQSIFIRVMIDLIKQKFVQFSSVMKVSYSANQILNISSNMIFTSTLTGIKAQSLDIDINNSLSLNDFTTSNQCPTLIMVEFLQILSIPYNWYILLLKQQSFYVILGQSNCQIVNTSEIPQKLQSIDYNSQSYYILQLQTEIIILDNSLSQIQSIKEVSKIIDSLSLIATNKFLIIQLNDQSSLTFYLFDSVSTKFSQIQKEQLIIQDSSKLQLISQKVNSSNQVNEIQIFIYSKGIQSIKFDLTNDNNIITVDSYLLKSFQRKIIDMKNIITAMSVNSQYNLVTSCSKDGQIMTWDQSTILLPKIVDSSTINTYGSCQSIKYYQETNVLILFDNSIISFNAIRSQILNTWTFQKPQSKMTNRYIFTMNNYLYLMYDSCFIVTDFAYSEIFRDCSSFFDDTIKKAILDPSMILVVQKIQSFSTFQVDLMNKQLISIGNYLLSMPIISYWKIRNFPSDYQTQNSIIFEIVAFFLDSSFIIFKETLTPIHTQNKIPLSSAIDISFVESDPTDNIYAIGGITNQKSASFKYQIWTVVRFSNQAYQACLASSVNKIFPLIKYINSYTGNTEYSIKVSLVLSFLTLTQDFNWSIQKSDGYVQEVSLGQQVFMNVFDLIKNTQFNLYGDTKGVMTVNPTRRKFYYKVHESSVQELTQKDFIKEVQQSLALQMYFVIKSNIIVYNLYTNEKIEQIDINSSSLSAIRSFKILDSFMIIICIKDNIIFVKNYQLNQVYQYNQLPSVSNYIVENDRIYVFGTQIVLLGLDLSFKISQTTNLDNSTVQQCLLIPNALICKMASATLYLYDKFTLDPIRSFQQRFVDNSFSFQIDIVNQRIILFSSNIEVYSFSGIFQQYISSVNAKISDLQIFTNDISIIIPSYIYIFDRITLAYRGQIVSPGGGIILKQGHIIELNQLVFYCNVVRFGQIFTYSLDTLLSVMSYKNTYSQNLPSVTVDYNYDKDQNYFIHLDTIGNFQGIDYQGQFVIYLYLKLLEYDANSDYLILGFSLDFKNNNLFIYTQAHVFHLCYGDLSNQLIRFRQSKKSLFTEIADPTNQSLDINDNTFIVAGDSGLLYKYYNTKLEYYYSFSEEILQIKYLSNLKYLLIALSKSFVIFQNVSKESVSNQNGWYDIKDTININSQFSQFLCDDIYQTKDRQIYHYDFKNKVVLKTITLADPSIIIENFICSTKNSYLYMGLSNGDVIFYNRQTFQQQTISLVQKLQGQQYANIEISHLSETQTDLWVCFASTQGVFKINISTQIQQQVVVFDNLNYYKLFSEVSVSIFKIDESNSRFFLGFMGEKFVRVFDLTNGNLVRYLSTPNRTQNQIKINPLHLIIYSGFHVMIYDRITLKYIQRIRRYNTLDFIVQIAEVGNKYILIFTDTKFEIFQLQDNSDDAKIIDQVPLAEPILMKYSINGGEDQIANSNTNVILQIIGFSKNSVFEQRYSLVFEGITTKDKMCSMDIQVSSYIDITRLMKTIKPLVYTDSTQRSVYTVSDSSLSYYWNIQLTNGDLKNINFKGTQNSLIQIFPIQESIYDENILLQVLNINLDSFQYFTKEKVQLRDFNLKLQFSSGVVAFQSNSKYIYFNNIQIIMQELSDISFSFKNMKKVVLKQIYLADVKRIQNPTSFNAFFDFENVDEVSIIDIKLDNSNSINNPFYKLINIKNVKRLIIKNLIVQQSMLQYFINIIQVQQLILQNVQIFNCSQNLNEGQSFVFYIIGVQYSDLSDLIIQNNSNLLFIFTSREYNQDGIQYRLEIDTFSIDNMQVSYNKYSTSLSLVQIKNSFVTLNNINYQFNSGNIQISDSINLDVKNSSFLNNSCVDGGAMAIISSLSQINFFKVIFQKNQAFASGGAVYLENIAAKIIIDPTTVIINENTALIGGGLRLYNIQKDLSQLLIQDYASFIFNNKAEIYGNNLATFPDKVELNIFSNTTSNQRILSDDQSVGVKIKPISSMNATELSQWQLIAFINNFQSGGLLKFTIKLMDSENTYMQFSVNKFNLNKYPKSIQDELKNIQFKIEQNVIGSNLIISGQNIISSQNFDVSNNMFVFSEIQVTSLPNSTANLRITPIYTPNSIQKLPIYLEIQMRTCQIGEVVKPIGDKIYNCYACPYGFYSVLDPTQDQFWYDNIQKKSVSSDKQSLIDKSECQKCPDSASFCQDKRIVLKKGYWRSDNSSTEIIECDNQFNACDAVDNSNRFGCLQGYIGPTCRECDTIGEVWDGTRFARSYTSELKCVQCSEQSYQIFFLILTALILMIYFMLSIILFLNQFTHQSICQYLRLMEMLPISRNSIRDQSSFYLKILVNYIQISSVLVSLQVSFFPDIISSLPNYLGNPSNQIVVSVDCIISERSIQYYGRAHVIQVLQAIMPMLFLISLLAIIQICIKLKLFNIRHFHKYTLLNFIFVFFQPDQINFFSKQLTCVNIGSRQYVSSDFKIQCGDQDYNQFTYAISIPLIFIWSSFPLFIFKLLQKRSKTLSTCYTKYYFGYYYTEFKQKYYYWEFLRIYLRVFIVVAFTLSSQSRFISYQIIIFILYVYIKITVFSNPIRNNNLQKFDIFCYQILILNSILSTINTEVSSKIISGVIFSLHYIFILMILFAIIFFKLNNPLTFIGKSFNKILEKLLPNELYKRFCDNQQVKLKTFILWKKIHRNLSIIVSQQAIDKVNRDRSNSKSSNTNIIRSLECATLSKNLIVQRQSLTNQRTIPSIYAKNNQLNQQQYVNNDTVKEDNKSQTSLNNQCILDSKMKNNELSDIFIDCENNINQEERMSGYALSPDQSVSKFQQSYETLFKKKHILDQLKQLSKHRSDDQMIDSSKKDTNI